MSVSLFSWFDLTFIFFFFLLFFFPSLSFFCSAIGPIALSQRIGCGLSLLTLTQVFSLDMSKPSPDEIRKQFVAFFTDKCGHQFVSRSS